jgi:predicted DNA-binding transcriptional regulator AlpA
MAGFAYCGECGQRVEYVRVPQTAAILGVNARHVRALLSEGAFPGAVKVKPPGQAAFWKIPLAAVQARLEARTIV